MGPFIGDLMRGPIHLHLFLDISEWLTDVSKHNMTNLLLLFTIQTDHFCNFDQVVDKHFKTSFSVLCVHAWFVLWKNNLSIETKLIF